MQRYSDLNSLDTRQLLDILHQVSDILFERLAKPEPTESEQRENIAPVSRETSECSLCFNQKHSDVSWDTCRVCRNSWCFVCDSKMIIRALKQHTGVISCPFCRNQACFLFDKTPTEFMTMLEGRIDSAIFDDKISVDEANDLYRMIGKGTRVEVYEEEQM